jgi:phosphonate transport system substrate-binding protein
MGRTLQYLLAVVILFCGAAPVGAGNIRAEEPFVFAVSPMASPVVTASTFADFIDYLSEKMQRKVILKQRRKYQEINDMLKEGKAKVAFTCTGAYIAGRQEFGLQLLAVPVINGKTTYHSYIIVHKDSPIKTFEELKGKVFAFTDPLSLSGRLYVTSLLNERGTVTSEYFRRTFYTAGHEKSIETVAKGLADAASVDSLIYDDLRAKGDPNAMALKIIGISPPFGIPPFVVSPKTTEQERRDFLHILLYMKKDPKGRVILNKLGIDDFKMPEHSAYKSAMEIRNRVVE